MIRIRKLRLKPGRLPQEELLDQFEMVILNDRIAQELMAGLIDLFPDRLPISCNLDLQVLAYVDRLNSGIAHVGQRVLDGFALGIHHGSFRCNDNSCFHDTLRP